jgi:hypothetical protein
MASIYIIQELIDLLRWLGVFFDYKLKFKAYVCILAIKALIVRNTLCSLGKITHGIPLIYL